MKIFKSDTTIILISLISLFCGYKSQSSTSENKAFPTNIDVNSIGTVGLDTTTNDDFSCTISFNKNRYIKGEPVIVKVKLTNHMDNDVTIRDCAQHYPFYSFVISDPAWRQINLKKKLETSFEKLDPEFKIIKPNQSYDVEISLSDWYDFSQIGRYSIKAKWCCFMKRAPYERNSTISEIVITPREQKEWFDPNKIPIEPIWSGVPVNWSENILRQKLTTYLRKKMEHDFNDITTSTKDGGIHLAYHTKEYHIERPSDKSLEADVNRYKAETVPRTETGPQSDGLILDIWLNEQVGQLERPQLLDRTYWKLYAAELYLPEMKLYIEANINYGADVDKNTLTKYRDLARWMDNIAGIKTDSNKSNLPDYAIEVLRVFPEWEVMQCDEKPSLKIDGHEGYRLVLRQSWNEYMALFQSERGPSDDDSRFVTKFNHIDLVLFKNENTIPNNIIEKIPWLGLKQERFVKPVYIGKGYGFNWFVNTAISFQENLRKGLKLEGGEDRLNLLTEALFIKDDPWTIDSVTNLLSEFGDKAVESIEQAVQLHNSKDSWSAIIALKTIQSEKSAELLKKYYYSKDSEISNAASYSLIFKPFKEQAKKEYFDMLSKQKYIREIGKACEEFNWKDALPIFEDICSKPKRWSNYYIALIRKRSLEGRPVPEELINAQEIIRFSAFSTDEKDMKAVTEAKQKILKSTDNFNTKTTDAIVNKVSNIGWDIFETLPKAEKTKLYNILEKSLDSDHDRKYLKKFKEILN